MKLINNNKNIKFKFELKTTNIFEKLIFINKPQIDILLELKKKIPDYYLFYLLIDKYEPITFKNINRYYLLSIKDNINYPFLKLKNNTFSIYDMELFPLIKSFNITNYTNNTYSAAYKYLNLLVNPELNKIINNKILFIKLIGPNEIDNENNLKLYFFEEDFFNNNNNNTFTIFIYFDWHTNKKYEKIINDKYDYIVFNNTQIMNIFTNPKILEYTKDANILYIPPISIVNLDACTNDLLLLVHELILIHFYLKNFMINSKIIINNICPQSLARNQLYYYLFKNMRSIEYHENNIATMNTGLFIFNDKINSSNILNNSNDSNNSNNLSNLNNSASLNDLEKILLEYLKTDNSLGYNIFNEYSSTWCKKQDNYKTDKNIESIFIKKIFNNKLSEEYLSFIKKINTNSYQKIKKIEKKIQFLNTDFRYKNGEINIKKVHNLLEHNILKSINLLKKYKIEINEIYLTYKKPTSLQIIKDLFPYVPNNLLDKIQLSRDSLYSVSDYKGAEKTSFLIKKYFKNIENILDCSSNIGGNTLCFSMHFKKIISNEINIDTYNNLVNNVKILDRKNIICVNYDIIDLMKNKQLLNKMGYNSNNYVVFLDPMWSGPLYKMHKVIDLKYGEINVIDFIKNNDIKYICMKVPKNFNFSYLFDMFNNIKIEKYIYCYLIFINK